jgi:AraC family transcriptional regulator
MSEQRIPSVDVSTGKPMLAVPNLPILSSATAGWDGIFLEQHRLQPAEIPELSVPKHLICIHLSRAIELEWRLAGERLQHRLMRPNDISLTPAGLPRIVRWNQEADVLFISLEPKLIARAAHESIYADYVQLSESWGRPDPQIQHIGLALKAELETGGLAGRLYGESLANALAVHLLRRYSTNRCTIRDFHHALSADKLRQVTEYINDNLDRDLSLDAISGTIGMSPYHFARTFKQSVGLAPHQYVIERRLKRAQMLLATTDLTIIEICFRTGFKSQSHFTRLFRKVVGVTPRVYRNQ